MNRRDKARFIRELVHNVQADILAQVAKMPEDWDGHELRRYIADKFEQSAMTVGRRDHYGKAYAHRFREYKNTVAVLNL